MNTGRVRIGQGSFGTVFQIKHPKYGNVVMKWIDINDGYKHPLELDIMIRFNHPNVMKCMEYHPDKDGDRKYISVIMDKADRDLYSYRCKNKLNFEQLVDIFHQSLSGVKALHDEDIIHLDIKANNFVVFEKNRLNVKLIDFGMCKKLYIGHESNKYNKIVEQYKPPENTNGGLMYGKYTDVWTLGMTFLFLISGKIISRYEVIPSKQTVLDNILRSFQPDEKIKLEQLLNGMLLFDYNKRMTVDQLLDLPIFNSYTYIPNIVRKESINYGTYDVNRTDKLLFDNLFKYLSVRRVDPRTLCNIVEIYHRYMQLAQDNGINDTFDRNKAYTLTAATCISFLINEDTKIDYKDLYLSLTGYHISIEQEYRELSDHIIVVNMCCQLDISRSPLYCYLCDKHFNYEYFYQILSLVHDPVEYAKIINLSPTEFQVISHIPRLNYSMIKSK